MLIKIIRNKMSLSSLPDELISIIGSLIDMDDILTLCKTSVTLSTICKNSQFWKNKIFTIRPSALLDNLLVEELINIYKTIIKSGYLYTFGEDNLRLGNIVYQPVPTKVFSRSDIIQVACGLYHTAALTASGNVYMFGKNNFGQLDLGDLNERDIPTLIFNLTDIRQISCGDNFTAFIS